MVAPKIAKKGTSFKAAGQYYLHDKRSEFNQSAGQVLMTSERVQFTYTENLATNNPELAIKMMAHTAMHQKEIKARSGQVTTGNKTKYSVYTYSLSWGIDQEPSNEEMIEAARETLKKLGLQDHETLLVAHNDTDHPHIHAIVNRIHPETGIVNTHSNDKLKLSNWAEAYEKEEGKIRCPQRVENNKRRRNGEWVKYKKPKNYKQARQSRKAQIKQAQDRKKISEYRLDPPDIKEQQLSQFDEKESRIKYRLAQLRATNRPKWAALYRQQKKEDRQLRDARHTVYSRFKHWLQTRDPNDRDFVGGAVGAILGRADMYHKLMGRHEEERKNLAKDTAKLNKQVYRQENKAYKAELEHLNRLETQDTQTLKETHVKQSKAKDQQTRKGSDEDKMRDDDTPLDLTEEFRKRAMKKAREQKEKDERSRGKGHGRERD